MGLRQTEEPVFGEEGVRPALVIQPAAAAAAFAPFPENAPKPAAYPAVELAETPASMVLEVREPTARRLVQRLKATGVWKSTQVMS